ncbi:MAG: glycosyltransferase family 2 protein [Sphingobacteriaceae bacterium]
MKTNPKVAVVILNWNGQALLAQFLPALMASPYPNLEIVLGDNASTDTSVDFVQQHYSQIRIIQNEENYGFAGGYNRILNQVEADYFVLLNSDVEVKGDWISPLISLMENNPAIAAAQPKILSYGDKNSFEYAGAAGGFIDYLGYPFCRGRIFDTLEQDHGQYNQASEIFWASGAALFIRRTAWLEAGGFDEDFFAHMEEIDLCWRLKQLGHQVWYCPEASVYHVGGGTLSAESPRKTFLNFRNNLLMINKNHDAITAFFKVLIRFFMDFLSLLKFITDGKPKNAAAISKAHVDFLKNCRSNAKKRVKEKIVFNAKGIYPKSIVWQYFISKKKYFSELKPF